MPRIALHLTEDLLLSVCEMVNVEPDANVLGGNPYAIITLVGPTEFNFKLVTEDEIFEAAKTDSDLEIMSL